MNAAQNFHPRRVSLHATAPDAKPSIFIDLDVTLIWTWAPLITSAFMSQLIGIPISTPPKPKDGYRKLTRVPFENGKYSLACCRPNIGRFIRSLRVMVEVCLLTHVSRDYALRMNRAFAFGFTDDRIFTFPADHQTLVDRFCAPHTFTVLIDDEAPSWCRRWLGRTNYESYDDRADARHREKCLCIGVEPRSRRDIAYPRFSGRKDDIFLRTAFRRSLIRRVARTLQLYRRKTPRNSKVSMTNSI